MPLSTGGRNASGVTKAQLDEVSRVIRCTPIIDNHAHPLLKTELLGRKPLLNIATEAHGDAIHAAPTSLAHHRAVRQLASVLDCGPTWESVVAAIEQKRIEDPDGWVADCFGGIDTILFDDGLDDEDEVFDYTWHNNFVRAGRCKRIVRIEAVATAIIDGHGRAFDRDGPELDDVFDNMLDEFDTQIRQAIADPEVVSFKSVICYRTGLAVPKVVDIAAARESFADIMLGYEASGGRFPRLQHEGLNDLFVHHTAVLIRQSEGRRKKPIQFHTGLGDSDITLAKASPAHLQEFIRAYPTVPVVLLHASYPFMREAGYLASVYANVYADIGEVFPIVSRDGQEAVIRQVLELCPWSKMLWSTDGHWFPETYLLGVMQMRECLETVLCDYVRKGHLGWRAAVQLTRDILFHNSNRLYQLELEFTELSDDPTLSRRSNPDAGRSDLEVLEHFMRGRDTPDFVRICWLDYTATPRMRMVPYDRFVGLLEDSKPVHIGVTKCCLGLLQNDTLAEGVSPIGEYRLHPDFSSLREGPIKGHISMHGEFREQDGSRVALCPRSQLIRATKLALQQGLKFLLGFEIEFLLVERSTPTPGDDRRYRTLDNDGHKWSAAHYFADPRIAGLLRAMVSDLKAMGIQVEQLHAESAPGQFELVLAPQPPVEAVDTLLHARDAMAALAVAAGYKLTLHPKPFAGAAGTAAHMHVSIATPGGDEPAVYGPFYAGVLKHLRALAALTLGGPASYERMRDGAWAGGRWVAWGTQNREAALRRVEGSHWELKWMDGLANAYLAASGVLLAGTAGVVRGEDLGRWGDCGEDPAGMTDNGRLEMGIRERLPGSVAEALGALRGDAEMVQVLGEEVVERYVAVKEAEGRLLGELGEGEEGRRRRREWVMERY